VTGLLASVSVDLDGLGCYAAIHGLTAQVQLDDAALRAVPEVAVSRLGALFAGLGIRATFFVIGRELEISTREIKAAAAAGHEIASHSYAHDYAISRRPPAEIDRDLALAEDAIFAAVGARPRGFRAPGYTLSTALLEVIAARGYRYDSSLLPSPVYYAAKALAMGAHALFGRRSHSILGAPGQLFAQRRPHLRAGVRELPVATLPLLRLPVIGTVAVGVEPAISTALARRAFAGGHFNLELHGIDALDASDAPMLARVQPGLRTKAALKLERLRALIVSVQERAAVVTLEEAAEQLWAG
jgi:hypothetical protein